MLAATLRQNLFRHNSLLKFSSANFAKFERSKPHLNVGTVGKSKFQKFPFFNPKYTGHALSLSMHSSQ